MTEWRVHIQLCLVAVLAGAVCILLVPITIRMTTTRYLYVSIDDVPKTDAAVVLGAAVRRGQPTPVLEERAYTAAELYRNGKVSKILVTGDNSALTHDEVTPVRKYLLEAGIPAEDIFLDHAGFDTYSSMYRAREIFGAHSVTVVTQDFHLPRAVYLARHLGLTAYGMTAQSSGVSLRNYLREVPASVKALLNLATNREPKYLGEKIPLTGDGSTTWY
ncbi:MAG TPA: ElyC/SanA/YdcF family protein [Candidatus Paceibacterota bacterium]